MLGLRVSTTFNLSDVQDLQVSKNSRPFANVLVKGVPLYFHGELFNDKELLKQLFKRQLVRWVKTNYERELNVGREKFALCFILHLTLTHCFLFFSMSTPL